MVVSIQMFLLKFTVDYLTEDIEKFSIRIPVGNSKLEVLHTALNQRIVVFIFLPTIVLALSLFLLAVDWKGFGKDKVTI